MGTRMGKNPQLAKRVRRCELKLPAPYLEIKKSGKLDEDTNCTTHNHFIHLIDTSRIHLFGSKEIYNQVIQHPVILQHVLEML